MMPFSRCLVPLRHLDSHHSAEKLALVSQMPYLTPGVVALIAATLDAWPG